MDDTWQESRMGSTKLNLFGALAFGALMLPTASRAADLPGAWRADDVRMQFAASGKILSADAMAQQKGAGLPRPGLIDQKMDAVPRVLLWDEMRIWPMLKPAGDGVITGNGIGR
jgi:hypothetical protein